MQKIQFKSTKEVVVNPRTLQKEVIRMRIDNVVYQPVFGYEAIARYFYEEVGSGDESKKSEVVIEITSAKFSNEEVLQIELATGGLAGDTFNDKFNNLIIKTSLIQFAGVDLFGLEASEWELVQEDS